MRSDFVAKLLDARVIKSISVKLANLGSYVLEAVSGFGRFVIFSGEIIRAALGRPFFRNILTQLVDIGFYSVFLVAITGFFSGAVLSLQSYNGLNRFGAVDSVPAIVVLSLVRELGPVLSALMVTSRVASRICAELGAMVLTSQIWAMKFLGVDPVKFLLAPRLIGMIIGLPIVSAIFTLMGCFGGYVVCVYVLGFSSSITIMAAYNVLEASDIISGITKTFFFGGAIGLISCYLGYHVSGGAGAIGRSTTNTVVFCSVLVLCLNYILTSIMF